MQGGWAVGTGAVILLGVSVEDSVEGTVSGFFECPFGASVEESFGECSVEASVKCVTLVLDLPVELVVGIFVMPVQLLRVGPTDERILANLCLFTMYCTSHTLYIQAHSYSCDEVYILQYSNTLWIWKIYEHIFFTLMIVHLGLTNAHRQLLQCVPPGPATLHSYLQPCLSRYLRKVSGMDTFELLA